jgi:hypothetical protein
MLKRKHMLLLAGALLAVLTLAAFVGCEEIGALKTAATESDPHIETIYAGQTTPVGEVQVWDDDNNVYIKYVMNDPDEDGNQWYLTEVHANFYLAESELPEPPIPGKMPYKAEGLHATEYTLTIPRGDIETDECVIFITHCAVQLETDEGDTLRTETGFAGENPGPGSRWYWWFWYCFGNGEPGPNEWHGETVWAGNYTNWKTWKFKTANWAMYLLCTVGDDPYTGKLYAGNPKKNECIAGHCTVWTETEDGETTIYVRYDAYDPEEGDGWYFGAYHVAICALDGKGYPADIPQTRGTAVPGRFVELDPLGTELWLGEDWEDFETTRTFSFPYSEDLGTTFAIAAHAEAWTQNFDIIPDADDD